MDHNETAPGLNLEPFFILIIYIDTLTTAAVTSIIIASPASVTTSPVTIA